MKKLPEVSCKRGAPMGRRSDPAPPEGTPCTVELVRMDSSDPAYDSGGAYWGVGFNPLYVVEHTLDGGGWLFVRAHGTVAAIDEARKKWPGITFMAETRLRNALRKQVNELKSDLRLMEGELHRDTALDWLFDVVAMLYRKGVHLPGYDPRCEDPECMREDWLEGYSTDALYRFAEILDKYCDIHKEH